MKRLTWRGTDCIEVAAIVKDRCVGCTFRNTVDDECPHTDIHLDRTCDTNNDIIYIDDTPDAVTEYALRRLEGV